MSSIMKSWFYQYVKISSNLINAKVMNTMMIKYFVKTKKITIHKNDNFSPPCTHNPSICTMWLLQKRFVKKIFIVDFSTIHLYLNYFYLYWPFLSVCARPFKLQKLMIVIENQFFIKPISGVWLLQLLRKRTSAVSFFGFSQH